MENFGYLEMAIAQENSDITQQPPSCPQPQSQSSPKATSKGVKGTQAKTNRISTDNTLSVGWLGLF